MGVMAFRHVCPRRPVWSAMVLLLAALLCVGLLRIRMVTAVTAVTDWQPGFSTFYGVHT